MSRRHLALLVAVVVSVLAFGETGRLRAAQSKDKEQEYQAMLQKGDAALKAGQVSDAIDAYKKANSDHGQSSVPAYFGLSRAYYARHEYDQAVQSCTEALKYTGSDKRLEAQMHYMRGISELALGAQKETDGQLKPAEARVVLQVTNGGKIMPPFKGQLSTKQIHDVAAFVYTSTHS